MRCFLNDATGSTAPCSHERCAFWEVDDAVCALERLGLQEPMQASPALAEWLRGVRRELGSRGLDIRPELLPPYTLLPLPGLKP